MRNLERDPRATLLVEAGERYEELRGVMLTRRGRDRARPASSSRALGLAIYERYLDDGAATRCATTIARQAPKRVALRFVERSRASWDHRKLAAVT